MPPPPATPPIDKHRFFSARLDSVGSARLPGTDTLTEGEYYRNISERIQFIKRLIPPTFTNPAESMPPPEEPPTNCDKRDYIGAVEYVNNIAESYYHEEGRINLLPGMNLRHEYSLRDHLGNTRICFTDSDNDGTAEILQQTNYYPFGLPIQELSTTFDGEGNNYQYNGIELIEDFGLHVNHAQFRTLDPQTGRWWQTDPMAELAPEWSPYRFSFNNPILNTDPLGLFETRKEAKAYRKEHEMSGKINKSWEDGKKVFSIESQTRIMQTGEDGSRETLNINTSTYRWSESGEVVTATEIIPNSNTWQPFTGSSGAINQNYFFEGFAIPIPIGKLFSGSKLFKIGGSFADEATKTSTKLISQFSTSTIDDAVGLVMKDPNKIAHLFAPKHNLGGLVSKFGGQENTVRAVLNAANGKLPASGVFNNLPVNVGGQTIFLRGNVINGVPRLGTMFIP
ncbi:MAG: RHS repeat-associated core domain-containing protein [Sphingobacteriales bacterium]|nr:MAG: RHS repeat-associated core domain-containing protein [Sphingobacteriales bacterium]